MRSDPYDVTAYLVGRPVTQHVVDFRIKEPPPQRKPERKAKPLVNK